MNKQETLAYIVDQASRGELIFPTNMAASIKLQQALDDPGCHLEAAAKLVLTEPLVAARLVAIANSVAYTRYGARVSNVRAAVSLLGFRPLRALVVAIVIRQLANEITDATLRHKAELLWQHSAAVAALAKVIAREFTAVDPDTALFAGIVHDIDGFYLLSRATEFPVLLDDDPQASDNATRVLLASRIMQALMIPKSVTSAVEDHFKNTTLKTPASVGEVLTLANALAPIPAPLLGWVDRITAPEEEIMNYVIGEKSLKQVLSGSADEIQALTAALLI
jgi:HD-like signal output (HDOD) protein